MIRFLRDATMSEINPGVLFLYQDKEYVSMHIHNGFNCIRLTGGWELQFLPWDTVIEIDTGESLSTAV